MHDQSKQTSSEHELAQDADSPETHQTVHSEPVWTYRGYQLKPSEFTTAMVHFFRAEVQRANVWRQRLDATTNWAVVTTGAAISLAFSDALGDHRVIILTTLLITLFLVIEARRYRYYELWSYRVRLMETDFYGAMLVPPFRPAADWAESLAENLLHPDFPISMWEAFGRRFRRNYMWIYVVLWLAWALKIALHPTPVTSWSHFISRAAIGPVPGWVLLLVGLAFIVLLMAIGLLTLGLQQATGEVLPRYGTFSLPGLTNGQTDTQKKRLKGLPAWSRPSRRRQQLLALIVTDRAQAVSDSVLREMHRGMTALAGKGMYTGEQHSVLLCALTVTEVAHLKAVVRAQDPQAFVIVSPAEEVLGEGFLPLQSDD